MPGRLFSNFPDMTAAITSWIWSLSIPRGMAVIPDHVSKPGSQCHPPNIPWDRAGMSTICPCQEMWADLPIQQPRRKGWAAPCWRLIKGNLCNVLTRSMEAGFEKSRSQDTRVPISVLPWRESVSWGKSPLVSEPQFPYLKTESIRLCGLHSMIVSLGTKEGHQRENWEYLKQAMWKVGHPRQQQQSSLPGCTFVVALGPWGYDPVRCYDNKAPWEETKLVVICSTRGLSGAER